MRCLQLFSFNNLKNIETENLPVSVSDFVCHFSLLGLFWWNRFLCTPYHDNGIVAGT